MVSLLHLINVSEFLPSLTSAFCFFFYLLHNPVTDIYEWANKRTPGALLYNCFALTFPVLHWACETEKARLEPYLVVCVTWFCAGVDAGAYASKKDRSGDAAFPKLGAGAAVGGGTGNCLPNYKLKEKTETEKKFPLGEQFQTFQRSNGF